MQVVLDFPDLPTLSLPQEGRVVHWADPGMGQHDGPWGFSAWENQGVVGSFCMSFLATVCTRSALRIEVVPAHAYREAQLHAKS